MTRSLRWVRISDEFELLDAPGIIPLKLEDQEAGGKLAICDDIGDASYDNQLVAAAFIDIITYVEAVAPQLSAKKALRSRYEFDPTDYTGEAYLHALAEYRHNGDVERTARELLTDYRKGLLGQIPLEIPAQFANE